MADVIKMTDGTTSIDLYYDTDGFEMLAGGNDFGTADHKNLYHESAALDGAMLVRHSKENRSWSFKLAIRGASNTAIATTLGAFNRLVDQARDYQLSGFGRKVYLEIQLDGASQATYYDVIDVDYSKAAFFNYYNLRAKELIFGDGLSLTVITKPIGYGAEESLRNEIVNPHFETGDGTMASHWNKYSGQDEAFITNSPEGTPVSYYKLGSPGSDMDRYAVRFTATDTTNISKITFPVYKSGSPTGNLYLAIYTDVGNPYSLVGTSDAVSIATLNTSYELVPFTFTVEPIIEIDTSYFIVLYSSDYTCGASDYVIVVIVISTPSGIPWVMWRTSAGTWEWLDELPPDAGSDMEYVIYSYGDITVVRLVTTITGGAVTGQRVTTGNSNTVGLRSSAVDCSAYQGDDFVAYAWVGKESGDEITVSIVGDVSGTIDSATYSESALSPLSVSPYYYKRIELSGKVGASDTSMTMRIERLTGDASSTTVFRVTMCFLQFGTTSIPSAWASGCKINNYYDIDALPCIDITYLPGDLRNKLSISIVPDEDAASYIHIASGLRSMYPDHMWWIKGSNYSYPGRAGNLVDRTTSVGTSWKSVMVSAYFIPNTIYGKFIAMLAIEPTSAREIDVRIGITKSNIADFARYTGESSASLSTGWQIITTGVFEYSNVAPIYGGGIVPQIKLKSGTSITTYVNFMAIIPVNDQYTISAPGATTGYVFIDPDGQGSNVSLVSPGQYTQTNIPVLGGGMSLLPRCLQRLFFMFYGESLSDKVHNLSGADVTIKYRPQTEFLLP